MSWVLPDNGCVMNRGVVMKIEPDRWRGEQHVNCNTRGRRSRYPGPAILVNVLARAAAVINLVARVIHVIILDGDSRFHLHRRGLHIYTPVMRPVYDAPCQRS